MTGHRPSGAPAGPSPAWADARLVESCLRGDERAWAALIEKYKRLVYSIPLKYRATPEDAADVFQAVCLELYNELPRLRQVESLPSWLITVTTHQCFHWKRKHQRRTQVEGGEISSEPAANGEPSPVELLHEAEREQAVRQALLELPTRCQEMIRLLFYRQPPLPYSEVACRHGLATGSIGFIRGRCLKRLQRILEQCGVL